VTEPAEEEPAVCLGGCRHRLTSDLSKARGYGPDCWKKLHGRTARRPRTAKPPGAARPGPDQPELPYDDQLPLWSST
jgi:hypothetical protein